MKPSVSPKPPPFKNVLKVTGSSFDNGKNQKTAPENLKSETRYNLSTKFVSHEIGYCQTIDIMNEFRN